MTRNGPSLLIVCVLVSFANASLTSFNLESRSQIYPVKLESGAFNVGLRGASPNLALRGGNLQIGTGDDGELNGKTIAFVSAGYEAKRFILEIAHAKGVRAIVIDDPSSWAVSMEKEGLINKFVGLDMNRDDEVLVPEIVAQLKEYSMTTGNQIDGVCSFVELATETSAKVAEALKLPGPPSKAVALARSKPDTRDAMEAAGLPKVTHYKISHRRDIKAAEDAVSFPAILKPVSGVSSLGVLKVPSKEELQRVYDEACRHTQDVVVGAGGLLVKETSQQRSDSPPRSVSEQRRSSAQERINTFVVEEYLDGFEVDIDLVMCNGKCVYRLLTDNGPCKPPYFSESWSLVPSVQLSAAQVRETEQLAIDTAMALGLTHGVFHVEAMYTPRGPRLIEFNARLGGGEVYETNLRATGVDLVVEQLLLACGQWRSQELRASGAPLMRSVAGMVVEAPCSGAIPDVDAFFAPYRSLPGVSWMTPKVKSEQRVVGPEDGMPDWICIFLIDLPAGQGQAALDQCLQIEKQMSREFLELMDREKKLPPVDAPDEPHLPRRSLSVNWPGEEPLETHGVSLAIEVET